jgi:glycine cleavage system H protein
MKRFTEEHQWVTYENGRATMGITAYAAEELGEITFVELPDVGLVVSQGDAICVVESVKAASDVFAPVGGTICAVNAKLEDDTSLLNDTPETLGWICRLEEVEESDFESLMTESQYETFIGDEASA